jgi:hypothetical protein
VPFAIEGVCFPLAMTLPVRITGFWMLIEPEVFTTTFNSLASVKLKPVEWFDTLGINACDNCYGTISSYNLIAYLK